MPKYLPGAEPFFFEGDSTGCLLVHGFTGTPYEMRGLGNWLAEQLHFTVSGPALAGHATHVSHMTTDWREWYNSVDQAYLALKARCNRIFVIGLSLGGILTLHLAAHRRLDGIVAVSAPAYIDHPWEPYFRRFPFLFHLMPFAPKDATQDDTQDPQVKEVHPGYDRTPTLAARSLILELLPHMRQHLPSITTPVLLLQGRQDRTIPADSMTVIYSELSSTDKQAFWLEPSGHLALEDYAKDDAFRHIGNFINAHLNSSAPAQADHNLVNA